MPAFDLLIARTKQRSTDRGMLHGFPQEVSSFPLADRRAIRALWERGVFSWVGRRW
jgi:hypothetical protein